MPLCRADGCNNTPLGDCGYCSLHIYKTADSNLDKVGTAVYGAVLHTVADTKTLNSGVELTGDLVDKCDTEIGKAIVGVTGLMVTEAASVVVQGVKHIGTVVKLMNFFDW